MVSCAEHVEIQLPNGHTRVGYLLDAIENNDAQLQAVMANVQDDTGDSTPANPGKGNNFKMAMAYILPSDPVARKRSTTNRRGAVEIAGVLVVHQKRRMVLDLETNQELGVRVFT